MRLVDVLFELGGVLYPELRDVLMVPVVLENVFSI